MFGFRFGIIWHKASRSQAPSHHHHSHDPMTLRIMTLLVGQRSRPVKSSDPKPASEKLRLTREQSGFANPGLVDRSPSLPFQPKMEADVWRPNGTPTSYTFGGGVTTILRTHTRIYIYIYNASIRCGQSYARSKWFIAYRFRCNYEQAILLLYRS